MIRLEIFAMLLIFSSVFSTTVKPYSSKKFASVDKQISEYTCGLAVLSTLFQEFFKLDIKQHTMYDRYITNIIKEKRGITFLHMKKIANDFGFQAYGYKMNMPALREFIARATVPIIVHLNRHYSLKPIGHFVLLVGEVKNFFIIKDPAFGNMAYTEKQFLDTWSGNVLIILPEKTNKTMIDLSISNKSEAIKKAQEYINRIMYEQIWIY